MYRASQNNEKIKNIKFYIENFMKCSTKDYWFIKNWIEKITNCILHDDPFYVNKLTNKEKMEFLSYLIKFWGENDLPLKTLMDNVFNVDDIQTKSKLNKKSYFEFVLEILPKVKKYYTDTKIINWTRKHIYDLRYWSLQKTHSTYDLWLSVDNMRKLLKGETPE